MKRRGAARCRSSWRRSSRRRSGWSSRRPTRCTGPSTVDRRPLRPARRAAAARRRRDRRRSTTGRCAGRNVDFPFNRRRHARVIRQLTKAGAGRHRRRHPVHRSRARFPDADNALIEAVRAGAPRVVLATTAVDPRRQDPDLRRRRGAEVQPCDARVHAAFVTTTTACSRHMPPEPRERPRELRRARPRGCRLGHDRQPARRRTCIDFPGPPARSRS